MDVDKYSRYDSAFLSILQNEGQVAPFIDAFFAFLYRKTDFFHIMYDKSGKMGFGPDVAQSIVNSIFKKYEELGKKRQNAQAKVNQKDYAPKKDNDVCNSKPRAEDACSKITSNEIGDQNTSDIINIESHPVVSCETVQSESQNIVSAENPQSDETNIPTISNASLNNLSKESEIKINDTSQNSPSDKNLSYKDKTGDTSDDDTDAKKLREEYQANPDSYNGAVTDRYSWSQQINDVDVIIEVQPHIKKGKDVQVEMKRKHLKVRCKLKSGDFETIIDSPLTHEIDKEESVWSLIPGKHIQINFEKVQERWWEGLLVDEKPINVRKIDASRPMTDLDDDAQAKIQELMFNERQQRLGQPTSEQMKMNKMLEQAWDAEGSPFKGTPFDPTKLNISGSTSF